MRLAKSSLNRASLMLEEKDILWTTVMLYYAEYYALSSFLIGIGVKCENHFCSILISEYLLGKKQIKTIERHKEMRIDAQYYLKVYEERKIRKMLNSAKIFVAEMEEVVSNLTGAGISSFRSRIRSFSQSSGLSSL